MKNKLKIGDLVKIRHPDKNPQMQRMRGIVIDIMKISYELDTLLIHWSENYGHFWTSPERLEKVV